MVSGEWAVVRDHPPSTTIHHNSLSLLWSMDWAVVSGKWAETTHHHILILVLVILILIIILILVLVLTPILILIMLGGVWS